MRFKTTIQGVLLGFLLGSAVLYALPSDKVVKHPKPDSPLKERWDWALKESGSKTYKKGFWIGYSIEKLMGKNSFTGTFREDWKKDVSLSELIYGIKIEDPDDKLSDGEKIRRAAREALDDLEDRDQPREKVLKELAILFQYSDTRRIDDVKISNMCLRVDLEKMPLIWLGKGQEKESVSLLGRLYQKAEQNDDKEEMVTVVGIHPPSDDVFAFLEKVLMSRDHDDIRENAAFWLGQQDNEKALKILVRTARPTAPPMCAKKRCLPSVNWISRKLRMR